jgi:hypothetical protein
MRRLRVTLFRLGQAPASLVILLQTGAQGPPDWAKSLCLWPKRNGVAPPPLPAHRRSLAEDIVLDLPIRGSHFKEPARLASLPFPLPLRI